MWERIRLGFTIPAYAKRSCLRSRYCWSIGSAGGSRIEAANMTRITLRRWARIGLMALGMMTLTTSSVARAGVEIVGDSATIGYPANDRDMVVFDSHPDVRKIMIGPSEPWSGPGPIPPFLITDAGFAHIARCKKLETLTISSIHPMRISAEGYRAIAGLTQLRVLHLGRISDAGVAHLSGLTNLEELGFGARGHHR